MRFGRIAELEWDGGDRVERERREWGALCGREARSREETIAMKVMEDGGGGSTAVMVLQSPRGQGQREGLLNRTARGRVGEVSGLN